jgi:uncharacterized protein (DUF1501 family)
VLVHVPGGWDPARVLADGLGHAVARREPGASRGEYAGLGVIEHPSRPGASRFFAAHAARCVIFDGVAMASLDPANAAQALLAGFEVQASCRAAVNALAAGSRRVSFAAGPDAARDAHRDDDRRQSRLWELLFGELEALVGSLASIPGPDGVPLASDTLLVVASELGRAPRADVHGGKADWPFTSLLAMGPGLRGGRRVGGWDRCWYGLPVDARTGEVEPSGAPLALDTVRATLFAAAGMPIGGGRPPAAVIEAVLA